VEVGIGWKELTLATDISGLKYIGTASM